MKKVTCFMIVSAAMSLFIACTGSTGAFEGADGIGPGRMHISFALTSDIVSGSVDIDKGMLHESSEITIRNGVGSATFHSIEVGEWQVSARLFDSDQTEVCAGSGRALVLKNRTTVVEVKLKRNAGNLIVDVTMPDEPDIDGLILWSKLGGESEVASSEFGPDGRIVGDILYEACQYGDGFRPAERTGDPNMPDNFIRYDNLALERRGCIEFWYKPDWSTPEVGHVVTLFMYGQPEYESSADLLMEYNDWQDLVTVYIANSPDDQYRVRFAPSTIPGWSTEHPFHVACVWDDAESVPEKRLRVFIDGEEVGESDIGGAAGCDFSMDASNALYLGSRLKSGDWDRHHWENSEGVIDNLKIWAFPKTDFSDRGTEG